MPAARDQSLDHRLLGRLSIQMKNLRVKLPRELHDSLSSDNESIGLKNVTAIKILETTFLHSIPQPEDYSAANRLGINEHFIHVEILHQRTMRDLPHIIKALCIGTADHTSLVGGKTEWVTAFAQLLRRLRVKRRRR